MRYVALLRGIGPSNPNMHPEKLRGAFEKMGFKNVSTVISSGNVVFDPGVKNVALLEKKIEVALPKLLGFKSTTIIRSQKELEALIKKNPFKRTKHSGLYLLVTFFKHKPESALKLPYKGAGYTVLTMYDRVICSAVNIKNTKTPDVMRVLEKQYGKDITTRTWQTVGRIVEKMRSM
jgi:uncharacterized protein (DUF1697 family)